jgi:hypothetical protein
LPFLPELQFEIRALFTGIGIHIASGAPETIAIINNTGGGIEGEIWERGIGEQNEIPDEHSIILGLHLKPECVILKFW